MTSTKPANAFDAEQLQLLCDNSVYAGDTSALPEAAQMHAWLVQALRVSLPISQQHSQIELSVSFMTPNDMAKLNKAYRGKDASTNVLSFPADMPPLPADADGGEGVAQLVLGDLVLCPEVVVAEAQEQQKPLEHHWAHMMVHGLLHLNGLDHIEENQASIMESLEIQILSSFGITNPYLAKSAN